MISFLLNGDCNNQEVRKQNGMGLEIDNSF